MCLMNNLFSDFLLCEASLAYEKLDFWILTLKLGISCMKLFYCVCQWLFKSISEKEWGNASIIGASACTLNMLFNLVNNLWLVSQQLYTFEKITTINRYTVKSLYYSWHLHILGLLIEHKNAFSMQQKAYWLIPWRRLPLAQSPALWK